MRLTEHRRAWADRGQGRVLNALMDFSENRLELGAGTAFHAYKQPVSLRRILPGNFSIDQMTFNAFTPYGFRMRGPRNEHQSVSRSRHVGATRGDVCSNGGSDAAQRRSLQGD